MPSLDAQSEVRRDARGVQTREVLLRAAERLFAEQGIARTSTRQITAEAGISRDAVHYHFGSKSGLVLAIVDARTGELRVDLERMFAVNVPDRDVTVPDLARAMVAAATEMAEHETGQYYHPFLVALMNDPEYRHLVTSRATPESDAVLASLTPLTPDISQAERLYRVASAMMLIIFGTRSGSLSKWVASQTETTPSQLTRILTDTVTSILSGGTR